MVKRNIPSNLERFQNPPRHAFTCSHTLFSNGIKFLNKGRGIDGSAEY